MLTNDIRNETPKIIGINVNASIVLPSVVQLEAPEGLENVVANPSPLAPNIKNKTPKNKKAIGIPNNSVILFFQFNLFPYLRKCPYCGIGAPTCKAIAPVQE
ncbi:hypothetical protein CSV72_16375 [Sporosarcina sp. P20a]|nr:hypothetical protein CSV72_16375 [Sporosarcina sp. P20a]